MDKLFIRADEVDAEPVDWLWPGRIPKGALTICEGNPGDGKSSLLTDIAARESQGLVMPGSDVCGTGGRTLWISDEDAPSTLRRNLEVSGAALGKILIYDKCSDRRLLLPGGADELEQMIVANRCTLTVIDPITAFLEGSTNAENVVRAALSPLTKVAERTKSAILLIRHVRKCGGGSVLHRGMGSIGIIAAARSGLIVGKEPGAQAEQANPQRVVAQFKSSLDALSPSLSFRLVPEGGGVRVEWVSGQQAAAALFAADDAFDGEGGRHDLRSGG